MNRLLTMICMLLLAAGCTKKSTPESAPYDPMLQDPVSIDVEQPPSLAEINFESHGSRLNGIVYGANGPGPHPTVVLLHGFPGNEKNLDIAQTLRRDGFNVLFFHYRGAWGSEGTYGIKNVVEDVASATAMLRDRAELYRVDTDRLIFIGHSMGGFAAIRAAANDASIQCVAGLAPADLGIVAAGFAADPERTEGFSAYTDTMQMLAGLTGEALVSEISSNADEFNLRMLAPDLAGKSVLLVAADKDTSLDPRYFHQPMVAAYQAVAEIALTQHTLSGDHSFSWSRFQLTRVVLDWIQDCR